MAYQTVATAVTLNDLEGHSPVADVFKWNPSNICAAFYSISNDSVLARFLCISRASCFYWHDASKAFDRKNQNSKGQLSNAAIYTELF